jgi:hypothetical protein
MGDRAALPTSVTLGAALQPDHSGFGVPKVSTRGGASGLDFIRHRHPQANADDAVPKPELVEHPG